MQPAKHMIAALTIVIVAVAAFAFFAPVIRGIPESQIGKCEFPKCSPTFIETYSSVTYYYFGDGGAFYPNIPSYRIYL